VVTLLHVTQPNECTSGKKKGECKPIQYHLIVRVEAKLQIERAQRYLESHNDL